MAKRAAVKTKGGLLLLLSPTKTLDFAAEKSLLLPGSQPLLASMINTVATVLQKKTLSGLKSTLKVSDALAKLNHDRAQAFQAYGKKQKGGDFKPAAFAYTGPSFKSMDAQSLDKEGLQRLQDSLRIISGLYGYVSPLDLIQPYRLCMGDKLEVDGHANLYSYWTDAITNALLAEIKERKITAVVNVASDEYYKAINQDKVRAEVPIFKMVFLTGGRMLSVFSKQARGLMTRFVAQQDIQDVQDLKKFNLEGYKFVANRSSDLEFVFERSSKPAAAAAAPKSKPASKKKAVVKSTTTATKTATTTKIKTKKTTAESAPAPRAPKRRRKS